MKNLQTDLLVIGSGLAGLAFSLKMASPHCKVLILSKEKTPDSNTSMAQGGIAAVQSGEDSFDSHIQDTLVAGAGLCLENAVRNIIEQAPHRIEDLINWGVHFDDDLTREGGHSFRRILHFEDQTGLHIHQHLNQKIKNHPHIQILENEMAIDLILNHQVDPLKMESKKVIGVYSLNKLTSQIISITAKATILATGGAGKVYLYTSNWNGATGDGIAMAHRAGARIANLEFMQFHPTCLYHKDSRNFLISEALRGEGGELVDQNGQPFMKKYHPLGSLAPRDIVARSIDAEMKMSGATHVGLRMTHHTREYLETRFPVIFKKCLEYGIDMSTTPIPVVPAAHYLCGGILSDVTGKTDLDGLWVLGESACNGLHGANRLASNSLLECLAMAHNCALELNKNWKNLPEHQPIPKPWVRPNEKNEDELIVIHHMWDEIRTLMWNYVGIVRSTKRLERAQHRLKNILEEVTEYYSHFQPSSDILELRNIAIVADLTVKCALKRKESRGIHFSLDYPPDSTNLQPQNSILR